MLKPAATMLKAGEAIKGPGGNLWKVDRLLGAGTCCEVYQATQVGEDTQQVAIKVYRDGPGFHGAQQAEAILLDLVHKSQGHHANIVKNLGSFVHSGHPCLVQEALDMDVRQVIQKNHSEGLSLYIIQRLAKDLLSGVKSLHRIGFIHADLKLTNLLWSPADGALKIIDFSLSFHKEDKGIGPCQSPGYRAPEVEHWNDLYEKTKESELDKYHPNLTTAADMWSVGCILAELYIGRKLLLQEYTKKIKNKHDSDKTVAQLLVNSFIQPREEDLGLDNIGGATQMLRDLICRMLNKKPRDRSTAVNALSHPFFNLKFVPTYLDLLLLPTPIIRLLNVLEDGDFENKEDLEDVEADILQECEKYGPVKSYVVPRTGEGKTKVYIEYEHYQHSIMAFEKLCKKLYNGRSVLVTYFPVEDFRQRHYF